MASGYRSGGVDFDDLFDPYVTGSKSIDTGRRVAGVDLSQRYAHISYGSKRADVGYRVGGVDVSNLWAAKGTAVYQTVIGFPGIGVSIPSGWTGASGIAYPLTLLRTGKGTRKTTPTAQDQVFNWTSDGNAPLKNYEAIITEVNVTSVAPWLFTNGASNWTALNSSADCELCRLTYNSNNGSVQSSISGQCRVQIREAGSGTVVLNSIMQITGTAGQS